MIKKFTLLFRRLAITLMAGLLAGFIAVSNTISYGVTIFSGDLSEHLSAGIGLALFSGLVLTATVALTSSIKGVIAFPKAAITPIFALLAAQIATGMPASATTDEVFFTIAVAFGVSTFSVGLVYLLFGLFKLGRLIRFMPHPVFGGFMAGLGWLLVTGGFGVMSDLSLKIGSISQWIQPDILVLWLPGLLFAIVLFILQKHFRHDVVIPITFLAALAIFYLVSWVTGISFIEMTRLGWLLDPLPGNEQQFHLILSNLQNINPALILTKLQNVNWDVISRQALTIIAPIPISLLSLLFNSSGIELATKQDVNLNRELKSAGIANILASCGGGIMGYQSASLSTLSHKMGAKNRFTGVFSAAFFGVVLFYSNSVLTVLPKTLIGGLLIYLGLTFLVRWVISSYAVLPKNEYFIVLLILAVIVSLGLLQGVLVGILATVVLFAINYSRINVIRSSLSRTTYQSNVERSPHYQEYLQSEGEKIYILKLQGFIFFGTAFNLLHNIKLRLKDTELAHLQFLVLDYRLVHGIDSSALNSFTQIRHLAELHNFRIIFADISDIIKKQLSKGEILVSEDNIARQCLDIDHAVEWCENELLNHITQIRPPSIKIQLSGIFPASIEIDRFLDYLEEQIVDENTILIRKGDPPHGIYFIERGQITVQMKLETGEITRLRSMGPGTIVGELGVYLNNPASVTVVTDLASIVHTLTLEALEKMEQEDPALASAFHKFMVSYLGQRLVNTNTTLREFME